MIPLTAYLLVQLPLTGGHGTGAAWAETFTKEFNLPAATEIAMACATFGLVFGEYLRWSSISLFIKSSKQGENPENDEVDDVQEAFEHPTYKRKINARSIIETIAMLSLCLLIGQYLDDLTKGTHIQLPTFVWCLFTGVIIRNSLTQLIQIPSG